MKQQFNIKYLGDIIGVDESIADCHACGHVQQVAYSAYHRALTQICFTCGKIRTNMIESDIE